MPLEQVSTASYSRNTVIVRPSRYGMDSTNLVGLYDFEDGTLNAAYTGTDGVIIDRSGNNNHATIAAGSTAYKTATGIRTDIAANTKGRGLLYKTPLPCGTLSAVFVLRNRLPAADNKYPLWLTSSANCQNAGNDNTVSSLGAPGANGAFVGNFAPAIDRAEVGALMFTDAFQAWKAGEARPSLQPAGSPPKNSWIAVALSINATSGRVIMSMGGLEFDFTNLAAVEDFFSPSNDVWVFGLAAYDTTTANDPGALGDVGMAAFYSDARDPLGLRALIAQAKAKMALRAGFNGVTII